MSILQAIILGLIEGITEFLPVSSTAHLIVAQRLMGISVNEFFTVIVQLGAIAGLIYAERLVLADIIMESIQFIQIKKTSQQANKSTTFLSLRAAQLAIGTLPILFVGFLIKDVIATVHDNVTLIALMSVAVGVLLLVAQWYAPKTRRTTVGAQELFIMGLFQVVSLIPGTSRSGITAAGGALQKMSLPQALEYSFLLSIPALTLAGAYELLKAFSHPIDATIILPTVIGTVVAFGSAIMGIEWLRATVRTYGFVPFVIYRFIFAAAILWLL